MEEENRYQEALETAKEIDVVENVMIRTVTTQMAFSSMMGGLERGDYVIPDFQRMYRWSESQAEELAVSLVRGMPIPPIYCYRNDEQQFVILDGQQRILSLYLYFIGKFLKKKRNAFIDFRKAAGKGKDLREQLEQCGLKEKLYCILYKDQEGNEKEVDITYHNLGDRMKRKIDFAPLTLIEINVDSKEQKEKILHKIFANLNIGGTPLSSQELRNGIYSCRFYHMLYEINDCSKKWRILYSGSSNADVNKESKDVELLLRMCAFKYYVQRKGNNFILTGYKGKIATLLDDFSEEVKHFDENRISEYKEVLEQFLDCLEGVRAKDRDLALVSLFVVWDKMEEKIFISRKKYEEIINSEEYRSTISKSTSARNEIEKRLRSVYEQLSRNG